MPALAIAQVSGNESINVFGASKSSTSLQGVVAIGEVFTGSIGAGNYASLGIISFIDDKMMTSFEEEDLLSFTTYPNPAIDYIKIESPVKLTRVILYDTQGRQAIKTISTDENISIRGLKGGSYLVQVSTEKGKTYNLGWIVKID